MLTFMTKIHQQINREKTFYKHHLNYFLPTKIANFKVKFIKFDISYVIKTLIIISASFSNFSHDS